MGHNRNEPSSKEASPLSESMVERACRQRYPDWDELGPGGRRVRADEVRAMLRAALDIPDNDSAQKEPTPDSVTGVVVRDNFTAGINSSLRAIAAIQTPDTPEQMNGHEDAYREVEKLLRGFSKGNDSRLPGVMTRQDVVDQFDFLEGLAHPGTYMEIANKTIDLMRDPPLLPANMMIRQWKDRPATRIDVPKVLGLFDFLKNQVNPHTHEEILDKVIELVDSSLV